MKQKFGFFTKKLVEIGHEILINPINPRFTRNVTIEQECKFLFYRLKIRSARCFPNSENVASRKTRLKCCNFKEVHVIHDACVVKYHCNTITCIILL